MQIVLGCLNVFRTITSHFSLIIKGCFPFRFGVADLNGFAVFLAMLENDEKKKNVTEREKDKIRERLSSETNFLISEKIVTIFDCC